MRTHGAGSCALLVATMLLPCGMGVPAASAGTRETLPAPGLLPAGPCDIVAVGAGVDHSFALRRDETVWSWGNNRNGQLGNGTTTYSNVPIPVTGPDPGGPGRRRARRA